MTQVISILAVPRCQEKREGSLTLGHVDDVAAAVAAGPVDELDLVVRIVQGVAGLLQVFRDGKPRQRRAETKLNQNLAKRSKSRGHNTYFKVSPGTFTI